MDNANLPPSEAAREILEELDKMTLRKIMALPVSDVARDINDGLLKMSAVVEKKTALKGDM